MATQTLPMVSRAAQHHLERQSALLTTINMLKGCLALSLLVTLVLVGIDLKLNQMLSQREPLVVRVNDVGYAEAVAMQGAHSGKLTEPVVRYFLTHFVQTNFSRIHVRVQDDYLDSMYFLEKKLYEKTDAEDKKSRWLSTFVASPNAPETNIEVVQVEVGSLDAAPYTGRVEFIKRITAPGTEPKTEKWSANIQFAQLSKVTNEMVPHNPLGLVIRDIRLTQYFPETDQK
jgi:type IV secretory pathway TrbF-like protein